MTPRGIRDVVIVGGGVTAHRCAFHLRKLGYQQRITMLSAEQLPPYDRTALSKADPEFGHAMPLGLSPDSAYHEAEIELKLGAVAARIRPTSRTILCQDGAEYRYDRALIATGARPLLPAALRAPGIHTLREVSDLSALLEQAAAARRIAIVGGGLIGCELSSSLCSGGQFVTMVEASPAPLHQVIGADVALRLLEVHRAAGINVLTNSIVTGLRLLDGCEYELRLADGTLLTAECVVIAIGARPECSWLVDSGVTVDDGVLTDEFCETSVPDVFAAGDCARFPSCRLERLVRLEHWDSAARHGVAAAENMVGERRHFDPIPFFWSDQHRMKLAMAGLLRGDERVVIDRTAQSLFAAFEGSAGPTAGVGLNRTKDVVGLRRHLEGETRSNVSR